MYPLIEIKTVPIEIQMKTKNATLEYSRGTAEMEISRNDGGGIDIKSRPIKLRMEGTGDKTAVKAQPAQPQQTAQVNRPAATYEATATMSEPGDLLVSAKIEQKPAAQAAPQQQAQAPAAETKKRAATATESTAPRLNFDWDEGDIQIRYEMDKMNVDWKISQGEFKFTPGDIEISVEQRPEVIIKYTGGPIYVPPSSDPNYEKVDVLA